VAVFVAFAAYPAGHALWMGSRPSLYTDLIADPLYLPTVVNTLLFVGIGVNVKIFLALLSSTRNMTVSVTQAQLFGDVDAPWNAMMAAAIIYALLPIAIFYGLRRYTAAGLTMGTVKG
jgi:multiple sugar transport system permease protein